MNWNLKTAFRDFKRLKHITGVLFDQGMGFYVHKLKLKHHLFLKPEDRNRKLEEPSDIPENLRKAMDELGPTFIKLGQLLSLRPDLIPENYCEEFSKLQDHVSEIKFNVVKTIVEKELKMKLDEVYSFFDENPIASASIGQVHKARLLNGDNVVVKVQRPNVLSLIEADIDILYYLADLAKNHIEELKNYDLKNLIKEFERYTKEELDYIKEGRNIDKFYDAFVQDSTVIVPRVFWDFTTNKILTMSYVKGIKVDEKEMLKEEGFNPKIVADNLADCFLNQLFELGFFHADPHPANVFVCNNNKIALLDYGIIGKISDEHKEQLTEILISLIKRDMDGAVNGFLDLGVLNEGSEDQLKIDLKEIIEEYAGASIQQVDIPKLFEEFLELTSRYNFKIPRDLVLLGKTIVTLEGVGQELYPGFVLSEKLSKYTELLIAERVTPSYFLKNLGNKLLDYKNLITDMPRQTSEILNRLKKGELKVEFQHKELDRLEKEIDKGSNRVALSILIAALIVASSLILNISESKFLPVLGFVIAVILSLFLVISIYKERNIRV
jgi:ubiquinone biosynthesis protein